MDLPVVPPVKPMLAKAVADIPEGDLIFEAKWDGFRCIIFRDGDEVMLGSRNERPLTRYFPELVEPIRDQFPDRCVVDGEIIVATDGLLAFDALQQRIHPAQSRVNTLAEETPAQLVAFDLLALGDDDLMNTPFAERQAALHRALGALEYPLHLAPATRDRDIARVWFDEFEGAGLDGLIAKPADGIYTPNRRSQFKIKHTRTADCVVAGYRIHKSGDGVGSLLLGLHDDEGRLHHLGVAASFAAKRRKDLIDELEPYALDDIDTHPWASWLAAEAHQDGRMPGSPHRWSGAKAADGTTRDHSWYPVRPELVAEVKYEQVTKGRFRGTTRLVRWRPDRTAESCGYDQLVEIEKVGIDRVLTAKG
ncbi:MAG: ATP-dependent DNA ligase [Actinomycetia bacterium]|nr:ATP-dependent DNA ligase [Actinomycetes bacterium]